MPIYISSALHNKYVEIYFIIEPSIQSDFCPSASKKMKQIPVNRQLTIAQNITDIMENIQSQRSKKSQNS